MLFCLHQMTLDVGKNEIGNKNAGRRAGFEEKKYKTFFFSSRKLVFVTFDEKKNGTTQLEVCTKLHSV